MRKTMIAILVITILVMIIGVVVFRHSVVDSWLDSFYFVVATITTVGYGDFNLQNAPAAVKIFGIFLMLAGAALLAAAFGIITDSILQSRLQEFFGRRRRRMRRHIVLCGLGNVGYRVLEHLRGLGESVVVIEKNSAGDFFESARAMGVPVIVGDIRLPSTLEQANIKEARSLIAVSDQDLANLEAALNARTVNEDIRIVLRLFDQNLANKIKKGFNIQAAFSTSALAAPALAMAAVDPYVVGSFYIGRQLMLNLEIIVAEGSRLDGLTTSQLKEMSDLSILAYENAADGQRHYHPAHDIRLGRGDKLVVAALPDFARQIHEINKPIL